MAHKLLSITFINKNYYFRRWYGPTETALLLITVNMIKVWNHFLNRNRSWTLHWIIIFMIMTKIKKRFVFILGRRVGGRSDAPWLTIIDLIFQSGLTRKQKKIFALVKLMKKLNDRRSFFTAKIPAPELEPKPTPRPKTKDRGQIWGQISNLR